MKQSIFITLLLFVLTNCIGQNSSFILKNEKDFNNSFKNNFVGAYDLFIIKDFNEFIQKKKEGNYSFDFSFSTNESEISFSMYLSDVISDDTPVNLTNQESKSIKDYGIKSFKGYCNDSDKVNSWLVVNDEYFILNYRIDSKHYVLSPTNILSKKWDGHYNTYVLYNVNNLVKEEKEHICGVKDVIHRETEVEHKMVTNDCRQLNLASASDITMLNKYTTAQNVITYLTNIYQGSALLFDDEFSYEIDLRIVEFYVSNSNNEFWLNTNNGDIVLNNFSNWQGFSSTYNFKQLFTDRDIFQIQMGVQNNNVVGLAFEPGTVSLIEDFSTNIDNMIFVVTHELGHNLNYGHDPFGSSYIMAPNVNTSQDWSSNSISTVNSYVANNLGLLPSCPHTWVDYNMGINGSGAFNFPYNNMGSATNAVPNNGTIRIKSSSGDPMGVIINVTKNFHIESWNGSATIGN